MGVTTVYVVLPTQWPVAAIKEYSSMRPTPDDVQSPQASASTNSAIRAYEEESHKVGGVSRDAPDTQTAVLCETVDEKVGALIGRPVRPVSHVVFPPWMPKSSPHVPWGEQIYDLYVIQSSCGWVKVGRSTNTRNRIVTLASACPPSVTLSVLAVLQGYGVHEFTVHEALAEYRGRGEWFNAEAGALLVGHINAGTLEQFVLASAAEQLDPKYRIRDARFAAAQERLAYHREQEAAEIAYAAHREAELAEKRARRAALKAARRIQQLLELPEPHQGLEP